MAECLAGPSGTHAHAHSTTEDPQYYLIAASGPKAGQCSQETVPLSQLRRLMEQALVPTDLLVWPKVCMHMCAYACGCMHAGM